MKLYFRSVVLVTSVTALAYLFSFSGRPISDDEQLFASASRNLAILGRLSAEQLYGNLRLRGSYHGVEPAFPWLASLWFRLFQFSGWGHLQSLYLLPILFTSLSAGLLVILAIQFGYSEKTGVAAGLLFGLSTMAWPYAKTFFREPQASFLLLGAWVLFKWFKVCRGEAKNPKATFDSSVLLHFGADLVNKSNIVHSPSWISWSSMVPA